MADPVRYVRREIVIDAAPERVLDCFADPGEVARWYVEDARGDARTQRAVAWMVGDHAFPLEVTTYKPGQRLELVNVGDDDWKGAVLAVDVQGEPAGTRTIVTQTGLSEALREHIANLDYGWVCMLAVLKEYIEHHWSEPSTRLERRHSVPLDPAVVAEGLSSSEAFAQWSGERPAGLLASTPRGAVAVFTGFPGVFTVMGQSQWVSGDAIVGEVVVGYTGWGNVRPDEAQSRVEALLDAFVTWAGSESVSRGFGVRRRQ